MGGAPLPKSGRKKRGMDTRLTQTYLRLVRGETPDIGLAEYPTDVAQRAMLNGVLQALLRSIEAKDSYTQGHSDRVSYLAKRIAGEMGMGADEIELVGTAGLVHDLGKMGVPEKVLRKTSPLTAAEFSLIKLHPDIGRKIVQEIPTILQLVPAVLHHHERWDGGGYPSGLAGESIPLFARILSVSGSFDAMRSSRCYKEPLPQEQVLAEIARGSGSQFDPRVVAALQCIDLTGYTEMLQDHQRERTAAA